MQNSNWGNLNTKIEKDKNKDKDDYKPDPRMVELFKDLENGNVILKNESKKRIQRDLEMCQNFYELTY